MLMTLIYDFDLMQEVPILISSGIDNPPDGVGRMERFLVYIR